MTYVVYLKNVHKGALAIHFIHSDYPVDIELHVRISHFQYRFLTFEWLVIWECRSHFILGWCLHYYYLAVQFLQLTNIPPQNISLG